MQKKSFGVVVSPYTSATIHDITDQPNMFKLTYKGRVFTGNTGAAAYTDDVPRVPGTNGVPRVPGTNGVPRVAGNTKLPVTRQTQGKDNRERGKLTETGGKTNG